MPANDRQKRAYKHTCDIWRASHSIPDGYETWSLIATGVKMLYQFTANISDNIPGVGRIKRREQDTNDTLHFVSDQDVQEGDIVINRSILPDGSRSRMWGNGHRLLGASYFVESSGGRGANKQSFPAQSEEKLPDGVG